MMKTQRAILALFLSAAMLLTLGCAARATAAYAPEPESASYDYAASQSAADEAGYAVSDTSAGSTVSQSGQPGDFDVRKIVYNADMTITADDPAAALEALTAKAESLGGYLSGSYATTDDVGTTYATATIKVPADQLDTLVNAANALGKVDDYRLSSDDISLSYYDMQARLDNAKAEEQQLLEILAKCETVEDILAVRESLTGVRADIESYTAQMNLWDNLVAYATLSVTINRTPQTAVHQYLADIPVSARIAGPVTLVMAMRARVSVLTGARASARMIAIARRGSFGSSDSSWIEPTAMPLNCTGLPTDRPATDSSNTILYCCQLRSEENLAAHRPNSSRPIAVSRVKAPIST